MKLKIPSPYTLSVGGGMVFGLIFGDRLFPQLEAAFGDPLTDILLGLLGALIAALIYEIVAYFRGPP